jgi:aminoglycoside phosphotransferase (APT) family kinase protein
MAGNALPQRSSWKFEMPYLVRIAPRFKQPATKYSAQKPKAEFLHSLGELPTSQAREALALCIACECGHGQVWSFASED